MLGLYCAAEIWFISRTSDLWPGFGCCVFIAMIPPSANYRAFWPHTLQIGPLLIAVGLTCLPEVSTFSRFIILCIKYTTNLDAEFISCTDNSLVVNLLRQDLFRLQFFLVLSVA